MKPRRLGRGLDFLLSSPVDQPAKGSIEELDVSEIQSNPWQPRARFEEAELDTLAESIRRHGIVQPIVVRKTEDDRYQLVAGERRLLASKRAGLNRIPAMIRAVDDRDMLVVALVENLQRQDLGAIERARAFKRLIDEQALTHDQVSEASGLARSTVTNSIRLLELDLKSLQALESGQISEGHARVLLGETDLTLRERLLQKLIDEKMSVRTTEEQLSVSRTSGGRFKRRGGSADARLREKQLSEALGLKVTIQERGAAGRVVVRYKDLAEFDRLFEKVTGKMPDESEEVAGS